MPPSDKLRLVARIWLKIKKEGVIMVEGSGSITKSWLDLMDHAEEWMKDSEELLLVQYKELEAVMKRENMPTMKTFIDIYGKILTNSFSLRTDR